MTLFYIDGVSISKLCNYNGRIRKEAKRLFNLYGENVSKKYIYSEMARIKSAPNRNREKHNNEEYLKERRERLQITAAFMARQMGYSYSRYLAVESGKAPLTEVFFKKFEKTEKELKRILVT